MGSLQSGDFMLQKADVELHQDFDFGDSSDVDVGPYDPGYTIGVLGRKGDETTRRNVAAVLAIVPLLLPTPPREQGAHIRWGRAGNNGLQGEIAEQPYLSQPNGANKKNNSKKRKKNNGSIDLVEEQRETETVRIMSDDGESYIDVERITKIQFKGPQQYRYIFEFKGWG